MERQIFHGIGMPESPVATILGTVSAPRPATRVFPFATPSTARLEPRSNSSTAPQSQDGVSPGYGAFLQFAPTEHSWRRGGLND
jgi:hypothetical protein